MVVSTKVSQAYRSQIVQCLFRGAGVAFAGLETLTARLEAPLRAQVQSRLPTRLLPNPNRAFRGSSARTRTAPSPLALSPPRACPQPTPSPRRRLLPPHDTPTARPSLRGQDAPSNLAR